MPKARPRKDTPFQNNVTRSVFLYGNPNKEKLSRLREMEVSTEAGSIPARHS